MAAKRAAMRNTPEEDPEFQIAPMIDILLVLLVFFMSISSTEVLQTNQDVHLPVAKDGSDETAVKEGQVIVNVLWNTINNAGTIVVDEKPFPTPGDIIPFITAKVQTNPATRILIRADKEVRYEYTKQLLRELGKAAVQNITFSVVDKEDPKKKKG
jgi:biopolymer transport protein ExbD